MWGFVCLSLDLGLGSLRSRPRDKGFECVSVVAVRVDLFVVTYRQKASAGWRAT